MMGARLRRRSPPQLQASPRSSASVSASARSSARRLFSDAPPVVPSPAASTAPLPHRISSTKCAALLAGLVVIAWLTTALVMVSLHYREAGEDGGLLAHRLPIPMSTVRGGGAVMMARHLPGGRKRHHALPKHYFQLSPPGGASTNRGRDSPPWSWPIIHVVSTRFMQGQGSLVHLARSRLKLLEAVCLPSLMGQTVFDGGEALAEVYERTKWEDELGELIDGAHGRRHAQNKVTDPIFLWIIKVDPGLDKAVLKELNAVLEPVRRFTLVVGSNTNFGIGIKPGGWRDGQAGRDILDAYGDGRVYFPGDDRRGGDDDAYEIIRRAHDAREDRVVIETRLDADDAINVNYVAALQRTALRELVDRSVSEFDGSQSNDVGADGDRSNDQSNVTMDQAEMARWLYWCPYAHVQWNPSPSADSPEDDPGTLQVFQMPQTCVTAGLSLGFAVGTVEENVPRYEHSKLYWEIAVHHNNEGRRRDSNSTRNNATAAMIDKHDCGLYPSSRCAVFVDEPRIAAFRSRAMTSAGMHNIEAQGEATYKTPQKYKEMAAKLWQGQIESLFGIKPGKAREAADFMSTNYLGTVRDNLRGQCTHGHSCKLSSLEKLQRTIDILEEESGGIDTV